MRAYYWLQESNPVLDKYVYKFRPANINSTSFIWNMRAIQQYFDDDDNTGLDVENVPMYNHNTDEAY